MSLNLSARGYAGLGSHQRGEQGVTSKILLALDVIDAEFRHSHRKWAKARAHKDEYDSLTHTVTAFALQSQINHDLCCQLQAVRR